MHTAYVIAAYMAGIVTTLVALLLIPSDTETSVDRLKRRHANVKTYQRTA